MEFGGAPPNARGERLPFSAAVGERNGATAALHESPEPGSRRMEFEKEEKRERGNPQFR